MAASVSAPAARAQVPGQPQALSSFLWLARSARVTSPRPHHGRSAAPARGRRAGWRVSRRRAAVVCLPGDGDFHSAWQGRETQQPARVRGTRHSRCGWVTATRYTPVLSGVFSHGAGDCWRGHPPWPAVRPKCCADRPRGSPATSRPRPPVRCARTCCVLVSRLRLWAPTRPSPHPKQPPRGSHVASAPCPRGEARAGDRPCCGRLSRSPGRLTHVRWTQVAAAAPTPRGKLGSPPASPHTATPAALRVERVPEPKPLWWPCWPSGRPPPRAQDPPSPQTPTGSPPQAALGASTSLSTAPTTSGPQPL